MSKLTRIKKWVRENGHDMAQSEHTQALYISAVDGTVFKVAPMESSITHTINGYEGQPAGINFQAKRVGEQYFERSDRYSTQKEIIFIMENILK